MSEVNIRGKHQRLISLLISHFSISAVSVIMSLAEATLPHSLDLDFFPWNSFLIVTVSLLEPCGSGRPLPSSLLHYPRVCRVCCDCARHDGAYQKSDGLACDFWECYAEIHSFRSFRYVVVSTWLKAWSLLRWLCAWGPAWCWQTQASGRSRVAQP